MFGPRDVRSYVRRIIEDLDSGKAPRRAPKWVRTLAGPAALGLAVGLGSCAVDQDRATFDRDDVRGAKADGDTSWLCDELDEAADCDLCEVLGWYGDGVCDDFCDNPDPDCGPVLLYAAPMDCTTDADCGEGQHCEGATGQCPEGAYCIVAPQTGHCVADEIPCRTDSDCAADERCVIENSCPPGAFCVMAPMPGHCEPRVECQTDADCPDGQHCEGEINCPEGAHCILAPRPGECVDGEPEPLPCETNNDCPEGQLCLPTGSGCPEGAYCILPPSAKTCQTPVYCETSDDCADGEECVGVDGRRGTGRCPEGAYCILPPPVQICQPRG